MDPRLTEALIDTLNRYGKMLERLDNFFTKVEPLMDFAVEQAKAQMQQSEEQDQHRMDIGAGPRV